MQSWTLAGSGPSSSICGRQSLMVSAARSRWGTKKTPSSNIDKWFDINFFFKANAKALGFGELLGEFIKAILWHFIDRKNYPLIGQIIWRLKMKEKNNLQPCTRDILNSLLTDSLLTNYCFSYFL